MSKRKTRLCIITLFFSKAFVTPLSNLQKVLSSFAEKIYLITGGVENVTTKTTRKTQTYRVLYNSKTRNILFRLARYIDMQARVAFIVARISKSIDLCLFFMEGEPVLPMLTAKLLKKRIVWILPSSITKMGNDPFVWLLICLKNVCYRLTERIVVYSRILIKEWDLEKYGAKVLIARHHFLDFNRFRIEKEISRRERLVGYVGRLSTEKGVIDFVEAIPRILGKRPDVRFLIGGDGDLRGRIDAYLSENNLCRKVRLTGWISREDIPSYLNELTLIVVPSYTEGLPNIILEAMACGTPVLAMAVGAIPEIISDGETGFLLKSNKAEYIADRITEILDSPRLLEKVGANAHKHVREKFSKESVLGTWNRIIQDMTAH